MFECLVLKINGHKIHISSKINYLEKLHKYTCYKLVIDKAVAPKIAKQYFNFSE